MKTNRTIKAFRICHIDFSLEGQETNPQFRYSPLTNAVTDHGKQVHALPELTAMLEACRLLGHLVQEAENKFTEQTLKPKKGK